MALRDLIAGAALSLSLASCTGQHRNTESEHCAPPLSLSDAEQHFWGGISSCASYPDKRNLAHRLFGSLDRFPPKIAEFIGDQECDMIDCYPLCRRGEENFKFYGIDNITIENTMMLYRKAYGQIPREKELMVATEILSWQFKNHRVMHAFRVNGEKPPQDAFHAHYFPSQHFSQCLAHYGIAPLTSEEQTRVAQEAVAQSHDWTAAGARRHLAEQGLSVTWEELRTPIARAQIKEFREWITQSRGSASALQDLIGDVYVRGVLLSDRTELVTLLDAYAARDDLYEAMTALMHAGITIPHEWTRQNLANMSRDVSKLLEFAVATKDPYLVRHALPGSGKDVAWLQAQLMTDWRSREYGVSLEYLRHIRATKQEYQLDTRLRCLLERAWSDDGIPAVVGVTALEILESPLLHSPAVRLHLRERALRCVKSLKEGDVEYQNALEDIAAITTHEDAAFQTEVVRELAWVRDPQHDGLQDALETYARVGNKQGCGTLGMFLHERGSLQLARDAFDAAGWDLHRDYTNAEIRRDGAKLRELQRR